MKYEILEHKADLRIRAFGKTREELFLNMLLGMAESQKPEIKGEGKIIRQIRVKSLDLPALLVDFLSESLYQSQVNKEIYSGAKFKKFSDNELEAELFGKKAERFGEDVKAATHHNLDIHHNKAWEATLLFDI
jgi:SHS2 domain-containing protein